MRQRGRRSERRVVIAIGRAAIRVLRHLGRGLQIVGGYSTGVTPYRFEQALGPPARSPLPTPAGPPATHPEPICPDVELTERERLVWDQLQWSVDDPP